MAPQIKKSVIPLPIKSVESRVKTKCAKRTQYLWQKYCTLCFLKSLQIGWFQLVNTFGANVHFRMYLVYLR